MSLSSSDFRLYSIMLDGKPAPQTHFFLLRSERVAIYSFLALSNALATDNCALYQVGVCNEYGVIIDASHRRVCDFKNCIDVYLSIKEDIPNTPSINDISRLKSELEYFLNKEEYIKKQQEVLNNETSN